MSSLLAWLRRYWLLVVLTLAFLVFVIVNFDDLRQLGRALLRAQGQWVLAATLAQAAYYLVYALQYQYAFATVEVGSRLLELVPVLFASVFVKTVVPSGGVSGAAVFVDDAARRGQSGARAAEGALLVLVLDLGTLVPLLLYALAFLRAVGVLRAYQSIGAVLFLLFILGLLGALLLGRWRPRLLLAAFQAAQRAVDWLAAQVQGARMLPPDWAARNAADLTRAANDVATHRRDLWLTVATATVDQAFNLLSLDAVGRAYFEPLSFGTTVAAFSMEALFSVVTIIPNGLIVAEAVMVSVLLTLGVSVERSILITVVYRGLSVWLPVIVGFLLLRFLPSFRGKGPGQARG